MIRYDQIQVLTSRIHENEKFNQAVNIEYDPHAHLEMFCRSRIVDGSELIYNFILNLKENDEKQKEKIRELELKIAKLERIGKEKEKIRELELKIAKLKKSG